jgi:hypothetical protein
MFGWWLVDPIPELKQRVAARIAEHVQESQALDAAMALRIDSRRVWDIRAGGSRDSPSRC